MIEFIIAGIALGLLPAAIAKTRGQDFFVWWVYGIFLFPIALIHAFFVKPGSTSVERFVKGGPPSEAGQQDDLRARMEAWHDQHDRSARRRKKE